MIKKGKGLLLLKSLSTYVILLLYVLTPLLDSMVCAGCLDDAPFQCEIATSNLQEPHDEVVFTSPDGAQSNTPVSDEHANTTFCSICANSLTGVDVFSPDTYITITQWVGPCTMPALSELHYSIDKPPQNHLV